MPYLDWKPIYSTGIGSVDRQHLKLVGYMNAFFQANAEKNIRVAKITLDTLLNFTKVHFTEEEALMAENHYPDVDAHKKKHVLLLENAVKYATSYSANPNEKNAELLSDFLNTWLVTHILGVDQKYVPFVKK